MDASFFAKKKLRIPLCFFVVKMHNDIGHVWFSYAEGLASPACTQDALVWFVALAHAVWIEIMFGWLHWYLQRIKASKQIKLIFKIYMARVV